MSAPTAATVANMNDGPPRADLRFGRWEDVLADVGEVSAVITDPPYGARTHAKQSYGRRGTGYRDSWVTSRGLSYAHWTPGDVSTFVSAWAPRTRGWFVAFTSHDLVASYEVALTAAGRYVFAPLPVVLPGMTVRLAGDGPSSWCVWLVVSRPRSLRSWGTLPGAYVGSPGAGPERAALPTVGAKPIWLMRAVVRDYSREGDLVCDPCAGGGATLLAADMEGRASVGAECDSATHALASERIADLLRQPSLFRPSRASINGQRSLFDGTPLSPRT